MGRTKFVQPWISWSLSNTRSLYNSLNPGPMRHSTSVYSSGSSREGIRTEQSALQLVVKKWGPTKSPAVAIGKVISSRGRKRPRSLNKQKAGVAGSHLWRDAHSQSGEPTEVEVYCANCQAESSRRMDGRPQYTMTKGLYVAWEHCYNNCGKRKPWGGRQQRHFILLNLAFDMSRSTHSS